MKRAENIADVMRAEAAGVDLVEDDNYRIVVQAMRTDGTLYTLGHIDKGAALMDRNFLRFAVDRIKYGPRPE